jgi:hypothetical protein
LNGLALSKIASNLTGLACYVKLFFIVSSGYVLSEEAVSRLIEKALPDPNCRQDEGGAEDVEIGK